jgi:hypothetical protein
MAPPFVETYSTEQGALTAKDIPNAINIAFDCRPDAIALSLALREPLRSELTGNACQMRDDYLDYLDCDAGRRVIRLHLFQGSRY